MSIRKHQIMELFNADPEREFTLEELIEHFGVTTKPRKKLLPHLQSLVNIGVLYKLGQERFISGQSSIAVRNRAEAKLKAETRPNAEAVAAGPRPQSVPRPQAQQQPQRQRKGQGQKQAHPKPQAQPQNQPEQVPQQQLEELQPEGKGKKGKRGKKRKGSRQSSEPVVGRFVKNIDGFGFVSSLEDNEDVYLDRHEVMWNGVMHGDTIRVLKHYDPVKRKSYGKFVEFVSRRDARAIGKLIQQGGSLMVELRKTMEIVMIQRGRLSGARKDDWVEVEIKKWPVGMAPAYGEIVKIVDADANVVLKEFRLTEEFPDAVLKEAEAIKEPEQDEALYRNELFVDEKGIKRKNLSLITMVTIDGKNARDFDDAVACRKEGGGDIRLFVSIADVAHYVLPESAIDREAQKRTTSVYFPDRAIPMLPPSLSNEVCCLKPNRYRYCMTAEVLFDSQGRTKQSSIYPSVIRSAYRLTYEQAQKLLHPEFKDADPRDLDISKIDKRTREMFRDMFALYSVLRKNSRKRGTLFLDIPEAEIIVDEKGNIKDIKQRPVWDSHTLIEEFMIAANVHTAKKMKEIGKGVYRIHEKPDAEKLKTYADLARAYKAGFNPSWDSAGELSNYLRQIHRHPAHALLNKMLLRSLKKASYSNSKDQGHFALALPDYTHFTSPIRRYPDLVVHRILKGMGRYDENALRHIADICSQGEINAMEAERSITRIKQARYMEDKIGKRYKAQITGMNDNGMFVQLNDVFVEGYLPFAKLGVDHFIFDQTKMAVRGKRTGLRYKLGDLVDVITLDVDIFEGKVEFGAVIPV